jgi:hypothetical protein
MAKIQHYVPQCHLKRFTAGRGKNRKIWCFDKTTRRPFKTNLKNVGAEKYFYHPASDADQHFENAFAKIEAPFSRACDRLSLTKDFAGLTSAEMATLSAFIALQLVRTREHREEMEDMARQLRERLGGEMSPELEEWFSDDPDVWRQQQLYNLRNVPVLAQVITKLKWTLLENLTPEPFWTSDHPVTRYNPIDLRGNLGLECRGIQLFFPLSSTLALCACDPVEYARLPPRATVKPENISFQNNLQVTFSNRYLFSSNGNFDLASRILEEQPELGDPKRRRIRVD